MTGLPPWALWTLAALLGLAVGSFLNVCIHRVPRRISLSTPASRCGACAAAIGWRDNVPVISYLLLGGRCRQCGAAISVVYPFVEMATMALFLVHLWVFGFTPLGAVRLVFACAMLVLFFIDLELQILPNRITLPGIVAGLIASVFLPPGIMLSVLGALLGGGVLWGIAEVYVRVRGIEGMGMGDVKMLAMIGAFLGWQAVLVTLVLASFAGAFVGLGMMAVQRGTMKYALPFGTFLAIGALVAMFVGEPLVAWYSGFLR